MVKVELIYDRQCPNVEAARANLLRAFKQLGLDPKWIEWERNSNHCPSYARAYGSPTVLVNEVDCAGQSSLDDANSCRVYHDANGRLARAPSVETIVAAISQRKA